MKVEPYYQQQRCSAMTVVSGSIWFMACGYSQGFLGDDASNDTGVLSKTSIFRAFERYVFGTLGHEANIIII